LKLHCHAGKHVREMSCNRHRSSKQRLHRILTEQRGAVSADSERSVDSTHFSEQAMRIIDESKLKRIILEPGEYYATRDDAILSTLLGSCVSVCLYDPLRHVAGMNHFLLSNNRYAKDMPVHLTEAGRYGIHSMELLINELMEQGADRRNLRAKAFGGGSILPKSDETGNFFCVGDVNIKFVKEFLENERIPLVASELGGARGRVIYFQTHQYVVVVRAIPTTKSTEVALRDRQWWQESLMRQEQPIDKTDKEDGEYRNQKPKKKLVHGSVGCGLSLHDQ
jgi:chemotaxis protein CheD